LRARLLDGIAYLARHQAVAVVAVAAVLSGLAFHYVQDLPIRSSYLDLLPSQDPLVEEFREKELELSAADYAAILLSLSRPPEDPEEGRGRLRLAAEALIAQLSQNPEISRASYRIGEGLAYPEELLLYARLTPQDLEELRESAAQILALLEGVPEEAARLADYLGQLETAFAGGSPHEALPYLEQLPPLLRAGLAALRALPELGEPLARAASLVRRISGRPSAAGTLGEGVELFSTDGAKLVLQVWPAQPSYVGLTYCQRITRILEQAIAQADLDRWGVTARVTGAYALATETDAIIRKDMNFTTLISSLGVLVILAATFASVFLTGVALVPLLVSALLTVAWAKLAVGGFNLVTTFLPALVLGLGIDFSIHLLARYVEERAGGAKVGPALWVAIHRKGEASLAAALTTAAVFLSLLISRSRALAELGVIMSLGIVVAYLSALLLTPSLITLGYVTFRRRFRERLTLETARLARGYRELLPQRRAIVVMTLGLTLALSYQVSQVEFRFASAQLAPRTEAAQVAQEILRGFPQQVVVGDQFLFFVSDPARIREVEAALAAHPLVVGTDSLRSSFLPRELLRGKASLEDVPVGGLLATVDSLSQVLQNWPVLLASLERLLATLSAWQAGALLAGEVELASVLSRVSSQLVDVHLQLTAFDPAPALASLAALRPDLATVEEFLEDLASLPDEPELLRILATALPEQLKPIYYSPSTGAFIVRARMSRELYEGDNLKQFVDWAEGLGVDYFGIPQVQQRLEAHMERDFALSTAIAACLIGFLVWRSFGDLRRAALALAPLAIGYLWMLAGMRLLGITFNFTNIVISPLLIGIGVDSAIHILHRMEEERARGGANAVARGAAATLVPVLSTSLTTMLVFGTLLFARTPGLKLLGISALLGLGFSLLASLLFLPGAVAWLEETRRGD